jgi:glucose/mannose-6-phosphate isomerase
VNLNDLDQFGKIDVNNYYGRMLELPEQIQSAWQASGELPLPSFNGIQKVVVAGMGGSAIGAELAAAYADGVCKLPVVVWRDYNLPAWAASPDTLVIAVSHSGETEETLSAFKRALQNHCKAITISTGGKLTAAARQAGVPAWTYANKGQASSAVGHLFCLLLALFTRLGLLDNPEAELLDAVELLRQQKDQLKAEIGAARNPAKRMAGQLVGRSVTVFGSGYLAPVARRWKTQINEVAKAWADFEILPEADHNTIAGANYPEELISKMMLLFLRAATDQPRNRLRSDLTRQAFMVQGTNTDFIDAAGETPLANIWTALQLGDYIAFYLAMAYGVDPTAVLAVRELKAELLRFD